MMEFVDRIFVGFVLIDMLEVIDVELNVRKLDVEILGDVKIDFACLDFFDDCHAFVLKRSLSFMFSV